MAVRGTLPTVVLLAALLSARLAPAQTLSLPATGQQTCTDAAGAVIPCIGSGQDGDTLSGVSWPAPRFADNGDGTLTDRLTGLTWLADANCAATAGYDPGGNGSLLTWQQALDFVTAVNAGTYPACGVGHADWRLPNALELESLVHGEGGTEAWLAGEGFGNFAGGAYWSATSDPRSPYDAFFVSLATGALSAAWKPQAGGAAWPVRGGSLDGAPDPAYPANLRASGQTACWDENGTAVSCADTGQDGDVRTGVAWPDPRFADNGDGTVTDHLTGLVWLQDANCVASQYPALAADGGVAWQTALDFVAGVNDGTYAACGAGYDGWQLPNRNQLLSLMDYAQANPSLPAGHPFLNAPGASVPSGYWSSTTYPTETSWAWQLYHRSGQLNGAPKTSAYLVWPVRGIGVPPPPAGDLGVSPASLDFGSVVQGGTSPLQELTLGNGGTGPLTVSGLVLTGSDAAHFTLDLGGGAHPCNTATPHLDPGNTCTVALAFEPTTSGAKTALVRISSDDPDQPLLDVPLTGTGTVPTSVSFPDAALEEAIRAALSLPSGDLTPEALETLTVLELSGLGITDLSGLEYCTNLETLILSTNQISDLSPLAGLANLSYLNLYDNQIIDLSDLSILYALQYLNLGRNQISDIGTLLHLVNLVSLYLDENQIADTTTLGFLTRLRDLGLSGNQISDLADLVANPGLAAGDRLWIEGNPLDLSAASPVLADIRTLSDRGVEVFHDPVESLFGDPGLEAAVREALAMPDAILLPADLSLLTELDASSRGIGDLEGIQYCVNLTALYLQDNQIPEITQLASLTQLTTLNLGINRVDRLAALAGLAGLTWLNLSSNSLTDIASLASLTGLTDLFLSDNSVANVTPLSGLTNLTRLALSDNRLTDLQPLALNSGLTTGDTLWVTGNPSLGLWFGSANVEHIWALEDRGVLVHRDPITFFDTGLAAAVAEQLGLLPGQEVSRADLQGMRVLTARDGSIASLLGVEQMTGLEALYLRNNLISDLAPLAALASLQILELEDNQVEDLRPLAGLTALGQVILTGNPVTDVGPLVDNLGLAARDLVWLRNTALDLGPGTPASAAVWSLHQRGVIVFHDPVSGLFPDSNLEAAVAAALQTTPSLLGVDELPQLTQLTAPERRIADLTGLELCTNLTELRLAGNDVTDLRPLAPLSQLSVLDLTGNRVAAFTGLEELQLHELYLGWNLIEELQPLARSGILLSQDRVHLEGNPLDLWVGSDDVAWMFSMHSRNVTVYHDPFHFRDPVLEQIVLEMFPRVPSLVSVHTLQDMAATEELNIRERGIYDLTGVEYFSNLRRLYAEDNFIDDLSPLAEMPSLVIVGVSRNRIADLSPLQELPELTHLYARENLIVDLTPLWYVTSLEVVAVSANFLTSVDAVASLPNLQSLYVEGNQITDITLLSANESLETAVLLGNRLDLHIGSPTVDQLQAMAHRGVTLYVEPVSFRDPALADAVHAALGLSGMPVFQVDQLDQLTGLTSLTAADAGIRDLYGITELPSLEVLDLQGNQLSDLSLLASLTRLRNLVLSHNRIVDITPLVDNPGLATGDRIWLEDNLLALWEGSETLTQIEELRDRGVTVHHDPLTSRLFADANLEAAVRQALGLGPGELPTEAQLADLETLSAHDVADLGGIQRCTGLTRLEIGAAGLEDVSLLAYLTALTELHLRGVTATDLTPLAGLTALRVLDLSNTRFTDLALLADLDALTHLTLSAGDIEDLSPLQDLPNLTLLSLEESGLVDLAFIAHMTNLEELYLIDSPDLADISRVANFPLLRILDVRGTQVEDLTPLVDLLQLDWVLLSRTPVRDIQPLLDCPGLGDGDAVWIEDTYVSTLWFTGPVTQILTLQARGVEVHHDPFVDNDGVDESEEHGPDGADPTYDGNGDGIPDGAQPHVASLHTADGAHYVTLEAGPYPCQLVGVTVTENPSPGELPAGVEFPLGFFGFGIAAIPDDGAVQVRLFLEAGTEVSTYWKHGVTPDDPTPHWYEFLYDGQTGAEIEGNVITLHFVDDQRGDAALGTDDIQDPGAPGVAAPSGGGGGGGGGGGCFLDTLGNDR